MPWAEINRQRVLFVHVPKTGGSSVERFLASHGTLHLRGAKAPGMPCSPQHLHAEALAIHGPQEGLDWIFTIVRHPVARIISEYRYQMRKPRGLHKRFGFSFWFRHAMARRSINPSYRDNHFRPQHEFLLPGVEIFRFEDGIDACLNRIAHRLGVPPAHDRIHEKRSAPQPVTLTKADIARIASFHARDFEQFDYPADARSMAELATGIDNVRIAPDS